MKHDRAYLDNAATTWPKPPGVYQACDRFARDVGVAAARGTHHEALDAQRTVDQTRSKLRQLFGARADDPIVFCFNGTDALNLCIQGAVRDGDHVVATVTDHNSVLRPLRELQRTKSITLEIANCDQYGCVSSSEIERLLKPSTRLVAMPHASNVTGTVHPVSEIGEMVRGLGALFLVDAAQTAGDLPIDMYAMNADMVATSGHKGLLGPLGTGVAAIRNELVNSLPSLRQGGTGTQSGDDRQPTEGEAKYESGSLNLPGIAGLEAGLDYFRENASKVADAKRRLLMMLLDGLRETPHVTLYGRPMHDDRTAVVSFNLQHRDCHEVTMILEGEWNIQTRAGLQCAARMHAALGTTSRGGTVRASLGAFNTEAQIDRLLEALRALTE